MSVEQWMYEWRNGSPKKSPTKTKAKVDVKKKPKAFPQTGVIAIHKQDVNSMYLHEKNYIISLHSY